MVSVARVSHPQLNTAQIHVMVQSITALHEEALATTDSHEPAAAPDAAPTTPPTLILTSRAPGSAPLPPSVEPVLEDETREAEPAQSAEIIDIMERIEALAAATDALPKEDEPVADTLSDADLIDAQQHLNGLMARIDALMAEAETTSDPTQDSTEEAAIIDKVTAHPLPSSDSADAATDAAMQDIQVAVQQASPQGEQGEPRSMSDTAPEAAAPASGAISESLAGMIRDEVRTIIREELPGEVRRIVKDTLQEQNIVPRERQKLRTSRFRNS